MARAWRERGAGKARGAGVTQAWRERGVAQAWRKRGVAQAWCKRGAKVAQIEKNRRFGRKNRKVNWIMCKHGASLAQAWRKPGAGVA